jgi:hypothetical protein
VRTEPQHGRLQGAHIICVKGQWVRGALGPRPEGLASASNSVFREGEQKLTNLVVVKLFELQTCPRNALFKGQRLIGDKEVDELLNLLLLLTGMLECCLKIVGLGEVCVDREDRVNEMAVKLAPRPLDVKMSRMSNWILPSSVPR